ncbi:hypothetical protein [Shewanella baltica]|uniref:hypothetical protein n=1 Tax=Shewanella baltica TaxID=62322 RepID=UPI0002185C63|nr:hypothetical protein [Shewanella baltica]AEH12338.1 hypothetical protein Sbal117_0543 [Shewanella baltica OS117]
MKSRFSYQEHDQASKKLQKIRDYLVFLTTELSNSYPQASEVAKHAKKASDTVDLLRFALAEELHRESPEGLKIGALDFYQRQNNYGGKSSSDVDI